MLEHIFELVFFGILVGAIIFVVLPQLKNYLQAYHAKQNQEYQDKNGLKEIISKEYLSNKAEHGQTVARSKNLAHTLEMYQAQLEELYKAQHQDKLKVHNQELKSIKEKTIRSFINELDSAIIEIICNQEKNSAEQALKIVLTKFKANLVRVN